MRMFLFHPIHFLKCLVKSQPQRSYKKGSYIKKECTVDALLATTLVSDQLWLRPPLWNPV